MNAEQQILYNRGIAFENQEDWLNSDVWYDWRLLGEEKMVAACQMLKRHIDNNDDIFVPVDCDQDGYGAAAILINYLYRSYPDFTRDHVEWAHHTGKQHGLADMMEHITDNVKLIIVTDAGSNDIEQHKQLAAQGIDCIVLDHHTVSIDIDESPALILNVQEDDYPNKALTGGGITYKFCEAYNDIILQGECSPSWLLDLCAIANVGDMADYHDPEIRYLVLHGLSNLRNCFLAGLAKAHEYTLNKRNGMNYLSAAFTIVPWTNAACRSGTMEEKDLVFKSMLDMYSLIPVDSSKRGHSGEKCLLWEEAVTVAERVKRRQTKLQDEAMDYFENQIIEDNLNDDSMLFLLDRDNTVSPQLRGLIANKLQAEYQKPTAVLTPIEQEDGSIELCGSMRNYSLSVNQDLKTTLESTGLVACAGHANAAGCFINADDLLRVIDKMNDIYKDIDQTPVYWVDYIWHNTADYDTVMDIGNLNIYGQGIPESLVAIENLDLSQCGIQLLSRDKNPTLKIVLPNGVTIMKFKSSKEEFEEFNSENMVLTLVGSCSNNEWMGNVTPQIIMENYELKEEWIF